jgi:hypothetical protein
MTEVTAAPETTEAAPLSVEEMREIIEKARYGTALTPDEEARAIATAVYLDRAINWILGSERAAGKGVIPALQTVLDALCVTAEPTATIGGGK